MKKIVLFAIIVTLLIPAFSMAGKNHNENDILVQMLKNLKGEYLEGDLNMGGVILEEFISMEEMDILAEQIKDIIGVLGEEIEQSRDISDLEGKYFVKDNIYSEGFNQISIYGYDFEENPITIMISSYLSPDTNNGETTLFINLIKKEKNFNINGIIEKIDNIFKEYNKPVDITTCVIGTIQGKPDNDVLKRSIFKTIKKSKGKVVEEYIDPSIVSYMLYTPLIENAIFSGEKKVNLNLAIRYNEYEDKTYIWIGTPIITTGY